MARQQQTVRDFFIYSSGRVAVGAGLTVVSSLNIQADSDFELVSIGFSADVAAAAINVGNAPIPNVSLLITDSGSGRQLSNVGIPMEALFGRARHFVLPQPRIFSSKATINLTLVSFEAVNANNISINLIGNKLFYVS